MSATGSATLSRTSPFSRGAAQAEAALPACSTMRARLSAKRSGILDDDTVRRPTARRIVPLAGRLGRSSVMLLRGSSSRRFVDILS